MKDNSEPNNYEILGVEKNANTSEIRRAYKDLARTEHPDKGGDAENFKKISEAYQTLSDDDKRASYDRKLEQQEQEQELFNKFKAENTLNKLINETDSRKINRTIQSQTNDELGYLQEATEQKIDNEVAQSKKNAVNNPQYQRKLAKYDADYAEWDDLATLMGAYGDPGEEPTKPEAPARNVSSTESKLISISGKIASEIDSRERGQEQTNDITSRVAQLSTQEQNFPPVGQWASFVNPQRANQDRQNNRSNEDTNRQQDPSGRRVRWADLDGIDPQTRGNANSKY